MNIQLLNGDCREVLKTLPDCSVNCCVTSPPYFGLRDYGVDGQIGLEQTPDEYVNQLVSVFREVKRVLRDDGTLWLNLGDSYVSAATGSRGKCTGEKHGFGKDHRHQNEGAKRPDKTGFGLPEKNLIGIPWMVAFALRADGWYLRQDIIWHKPNPMPESVTDRCTKAHEYVFLLSKSQKYYYDSDSIMEIATGYDGRKDTMMKGSTKYNTDISVVPNQPVHSMAKNGHERWKFKNLSDKGQQTHSMHERRADGLADELSPVRNKRSVWTVNTKPYKEAHFATFPPDLIKPMILAGCPIGGTVLDPFGGSGTTGEVSESLGRNSILIELNPKYIEIQGRRTAQIGLELC